MAVENTNMQVLTNLQPDTMRDALARIHYALDGDPTEEGKSWTSDEIEWVADVILSLGLTIREPGEEYESEDDDENECDGHESLDGAHMGESVTCDGSCKG